MLNKIVPVALLAALLLAACGGATPLEAGTTPTATQRSTSTVTATLSPTPTPWPTEWPTLAAATLAPYPLSIFDTELEDAENDSEWRLANFDAPLALNPHDHFYFMPPVLSSDWRYDVPSSRYGELQAPTNIGGHTGVDFPVDSGTPVMAAAGGRVMFADYGLLYGDEGRGDDPYGLAILIRHDFGFEGARLFSVYAHLSETAVEYGQYVEAGELIGLSGNSGQSTGPHLHFEVRLAENTLYHTLNPELWLSPGEDRGVLAGRITDTFGRPLYARLVEVRNLDSGRRYDTYSYSTAISIGQDPYYGENYVLGDLPAGRYEIAISYLYAWRRVEVEVRPGTVTFFTFTGTNEYRLDLPQVAKPANVP